MDGKNFTITTSFTICNAAFWWLSRHVSLSFEAGPLFENTLAKAHTPKGNGPTKGFPFKFCDIKNLLKISKNYSN
jgi:hypothetical protein